MVPRKTMNYSRKNGVVHCQSALGGMMCCVVLSEESGNALSL